MLLPLRLIAIANALVMCYLFAKIGLSREKHESSLTQPIGMRNALAVRGISLVVWLTMFFCGFYPLKIKGPPPASAYEAPVYVAAPRSNFLTVLIPFLLKASPVYNERVKETPIIGTISQAMRAIFYKGNHYSSEMVVEMNSRTKEEGWLPILLFPEEVYTNGGTLIHFPAELFQMMKPVQPVMIAFSGSTKSNAVNQSMTVCLALQILCSFRHRLMIKYLEVIYPDLGRETGKEFTQRVKSTLARSLGMYTSGHSKEDIQLIAYARDLGLPSMTGVVEFMALKKEYDSLTLEMAEKELVRFCQIDRRSKGYITLVDLAYYLKESTSQVSSLFSSYRLDASGKLTFRNFLEGNLTQTNGPMLSPISPISPIEAGAKGQRERHTNMLIQRHSVSLGNGFPN